MKRASLLLTFALARSVTSALAADLVVDQKDKQFSKKTLKVKVGDSVSFRNSDTVAHNVFSLSGVKSFDLGSYPQWQSKIVVFDKPGKVEVECCALRPARCSRSSSPLGRPTQKSSTRSRRNTKVASISTCRA